MARLQDDVKRLCLVDDLKKFKITFISSQRYKSKPKVKDHYNISQGIFKELRINKDGDEWFLTQDEGKKCDKAGENIFTIKRTKGSCVGNDWSLRYSTIDLLDKSMRVCKVRYACTADKFAQLCNQLGLRDDRMMKRAISEKKKIHLLYPKKSNKELSRVREAYKNSRGIFNVVKLQLVESVGEFNYFAFEGFEDNLATFIKNHSSLKFSKEVVKALLELHANYAFHTNFTLESILVKRYVPTECYMVKLCSMTTSTWYSRRQCEID
ncbi:retrovirus-related pol polyprotein from transposon TNT 1-94 [Tanacetum coccineum]